VATKDGARAPRRISYDCGVALPRTPITGISVCCARYKRPSGNCTNNSFDKIASSHCLPGAECATFAFQLQQAFAVGGMGFRGYLRGNGFVPFMSAMGHKLPRPLQFAAVR
jgi:hypothetical protein